VSVLLVATLARTSGFPADSRSLWPLAGFAVLALVAERQTVRLTANLQLSVAFLPLLFVAVVFGPLAAALIVLPVILFFQPGKAAFRERYWRANSTDSNSDTYSERIGFWVKNSWNMWDDAITDRTGEQGKLLANATLSRFSLLQQTANVMELTPDSVPYQYGSLYSYIAVTFIPRFMWPDKPRRFESGRASHRPRRPANG